MVSKELVSVLRVFSQEEHEKLALFLQSPYCTEGIWGAEYVEKLVCQIEKFIQNNPDETTLLDEKRAYAAIFPEKPDYVSTTFRKLTSSALKMIRRFIDFEQPTRLSWSYTINARYFYQKGALDLCDKNLKRAEDNMPPAVQWDNEDYLIHWQVEHLKSMSQGTQHRMTDDYNLKGALGAFENLYLVERLDSLAALFNLNRITPVLTPEERQALMDDLKQWEKRPFFQSPLIQMYLKALMFLHVEEAQVQAPFLEFMDMLYRYEKEISPYYLTRLEVLALNFCVRRFRNELYQKILFEIYERQTQPERLQKRTTISALDFVSMVQTGLRGKQYELVHSILESFRGRIRGIQDSENDYYQYGLANYYYHIGEKEKAREILVFLDFFETNYRYVCKLLAIKLFYEMGEPDYDLTENTLNQLKTMISRETKMSPEKKAMVVNFVNLAFRLHRLRVHLKINQTRLRSLIEDIQNTRNSAEYEWLLQEAQALLPPTTPA